jgi:hypothetical protein
MPIYKNKWLNSYEKSLFDTADGDLSKKHPSRRPFRQASCHLHLNRRAI